MRTKLWCYLAVLVPLALAIGCDSERHLIGEGGPARNGSATGGAAAGNTGGAAAGNTGGAAAGNTGGAAAGNTGGAVAAGGRAASGGAVASGGAAAAGGRGGSNPGTAGGGGASIAGLPLPLGARQAVTSLSRLLWQAAPDAALIAMADSGSVANTEDLRQLALRMLIDARAQVGVGSFFRWWLDLDRVADLANTSPRDKSKFPQYNAALTAAMAAETERFGVYATLDGDGLFATLLTAPYTFVNEGLASIYGLTGVTGTTLRRVAIDPTQRAGFLTHPGIMTLTSHAGSTSPTHRGIFVNKNLFCNELPPPPPDVPPLPEPGNPGPATTRTLLTIAISQPSCQACHTLVDPIGFGFEHYDEIGQYRVLENGLPVDSSGALPSSPSSTFSGAPELVAHLARSPDARLCMTKKWIEYAVGREIPETDPSIADAHGWFSRSGFNLKELIAGVAQTKAFLTAPPVCTLGLNQTCNDSPSQSSIAGTCSEGLRCVCSKSEVNPITGKCYF
ncbi:MAG: DUF1588 domain-containing protein [Pseudomonadota bacterium]